MMKDGNPKGAIAVFKGLISAFPDSPYAKKAQAKITESMTLKKKIDAKKEMEAEEEGAGGLPVPKKGFDPYEAYTHGMSQMQQLNTLDKTGDDLLDAEKEAIKEMWRAIQHRHQQEHFTDMVSDQIIIWTIGNPNEGTPGYADILVSRIIKHEGNINMQRWLAAKVRMLADRFVNISPKKGENDVRKGNLDVLKFWMSELLNATYFDNQILVGMYKYKADRFAERYDQTDNGFKMFKSAMYYYSNGIKRTKTAKARVELHLRASELCGRFMHSTPEQMKTYFNKGFRHAAQGINFMKPIMKDQVAKGGQEFYRNEMSNEKLLEKLQTAYGRNLLYYVNQLYSMGEYTTMAAIQRYVLRVPFDWSGKIDTLVLFAEACKKASAQSTGNLVEKNKKLCLFASSEAFRLVLKRNGGKANSADPNFCKAFNAYYNYLSDYGQLIQARQLENQYAPYCPN